MRKYSPLGRDLDVLDSDYSHVEVDLLWRRDKQSRVLILALAHLIPREHPRTENRLAATKRIQRIGKQCHIHFQRFSMTVVEALAWIDAFSGGAGYLPGDTDKPFLPTSMQLEPDHGGWNVSNMFPFFGTQSAAYHRVKHWVQKEPIGAATNVWEDDEATEWVQSTCGLALKDNLVWCGSLHLIAQNPLYRSFEHRLLTVGDDEQMHVRFVPRTEKSVRGLQLTVAEVRPNGIGTIHMVPVEDSQFVLTRAGSMEQVAVAITCPRRGLLEWHGPVYWLGKNHPNDLPRKLFTQSWKNQTQENAKELGVKWFCGDPAGAKSHIRHLFSRASKELTIVDPYFAETEVALLDGAIHQRGVKVTVLTTEERLKPTEDEEEANAEDFGGKRLLALLPSLRGQCDISILVARKLLIHDRFIVTDETVRVSGNSLHSIGIRGSLIMRVPEPSVILEDISSVMEGARPLADWVALQLEKRRQKGNTMQLNLFTDHDHESA
ncbi:hypothetical protein PQR71_07115 [Paraburkholderia fungorum]|uniref:hypothetical protein n=1 Tax=Paraburkholderia fungorum TaxID=134537 RepID=UPI0038BA6001